MPKARQASAMLAPRLSTAVLVISRHRPTENKGICLPGNGWPRSFFPRASFNKSACMLRSAYIRFRRRFSFGAALGPMAFAPYSMAFIWLTMDASVTRQGFAAQKPERACRHTSPATCKTTRSLSAMQASPAGQRHHAMLTAKFSNGHATFSLTQDRKNLGFAISCHLHSKSPRLSCRENSTYAAPYFRGGIT
jgi:hypothetical protein